MRTTGNGMIVNFMSGAMANDVGFSLMYISRDGTNIYMLNPYLKMGISHPYQWDESTFIYRDISCIFYFFYFIFRLNSLKQTE